jgi:uncharacterized protein DUF3306
MEEKKETFFAHWSRLKKTTAELGQNPPVAAPAPAAASSPVELPSIESLTSESDFTGFFRGKVDEKLRRAALKKMFQDPHFNVMDGLDVYIDDYSIPDPIPETMLAKLEHVKNMFARKDDAKQDDAKPKEQIGVSDARSLSEEAPKIEQKASDEQV